MSDLVQIEHVVKHYGMKKMIFQDLNLNIVSGKIIGLLGPNGSGKTTLIKLLSGLLSPVQGTILIDGKEIGPETKAIVSYLPERTYFNESLKGKNLVNMFKDFYADFDEERVSDCTIKFISFVFNSFLTS